MTRLISNFFGIWKNSRKPLKKHFEKKIFSVAGQVFDFQKIKSKTSKH